MLLFIFSCVALLCFSNSVRQFLRVVVQKQYLFVQIVIVIAATSSFSQKPKPFLPIQIEKGIIKYNPDTLTGDRIPDFSFCGYRASEEEIPMIPVKVVVPLVRGDATATIQAAIDEVAKLTVDKNGFRGAVLLSKGTYEVSGQIKITASGIVLRGFGSQGQTIILGKGVDRDGLVRVFGKDDKKIQKRTPDFR